MRSFVSFRLCAQLCFCSAILCISSPFREHLLVFALFLALVLIAAFGAASCSGLWSRLIWGLLPFLALALPASVRTVRIALAVMALYAAVFLTAGRFVPETRKYRGRILLMLAITVPSLVIFGPIGIQNNQFRILAVCGLAFGILALRALHLGSPIPARWQAANVGLFLLPVAVGSLAGAVLSLFKPVLLFLVDLLSPLFSAVITGWTNLWIWLTELSASTESTSETPQMTVVTEMTTEEVQATAKAYKDVKLPHLEIELPWTPILIVLAAAAVALLVIWLLRNSAPLRKEKTEQDDLQDAPPLEAERAKRSRRSRRNATTNRDRVRAVYREYLHFLHKSGVPTARSATTQEISDSAAEILQESDARLRSLYRKARYSDAPITEQELREAKACLDRLIQTKGSDDPMT